MTDIVYKAAPTMTHFHKSDDFVRALLGPIGSGKSVACCVDIMKRAQEQEPFEGVRKTRWAIIRNTYRELIDTTMQTFFDWFPRQLGEWRAMDMKWTLVKKLEDGTVMHAEFLFRALDRPDDVKKLLSLELTGGWLNEGREIPKAVFDMLLGRVGRYPSKRDGGPSWYGVIADTNPPDSDHWWYRLFEENLPDNYSLYHQPSGLSIGAENKENLPDRYYENMMAGKDQEWINVYVHGMYGFISDGKPIYPEYNDDIHSTSEELIYTGGTLYVGIDFGLTPAAVFGQLLPSGQWQILRELVTYDMGAVNFAQELGRIIRHEYEGCKLEIYGDPAGEQRSQVDERTPFMVLAAAGIPCWPAPTNDFTIRREAVAAPMTKMAMNGQPGFLIGPECKQLRKGMAGGYKYKRVQVAYDERYQDKPDKNRYSHVCEALQYLMIGAGEGTRVISNDKWTKQPDYSNHDRMVV